jgi:hypothetical protein
LAMVNGRNDNVIRTDARRDSNGVPNRGVVITIRRRTSNEVKDIQLLVGIAGAKHRECPRVALPRRRGIRGNNGDDGDSGSGGLRSAATAETVQKRQCECGRAYGTQRKQTFSFHTNQAFRPCPLVFVPACL